MTNLDINPGPWGTPDAADPHVFAPRDPSTFPSTDFLKGKSDTAIESLRESCLHGKDSLYIMSKVILGYSKMNERVHLPMARFAVQTRHPGMRRLMLMPRGHFKTTLWTICEPIQLLCLDPNIQFLLVADTGMNAAQFMKEVQNHFKYNNLFRTVFYDIIPENFNDVVWNQFQMEVNRPVRISRGPSIDAIGALGGSESRHYHYIKADDLVTEKCIRSDVEMEKVINWAGGLESLLVTPKDDSIDFIGSRKKKGDLYEQQEKYYGEGYLTQQIGPHATQKGDIIIFSRTAEENGEPIFPEIITKKFLSRLRKYEPERYHAQYANSPKGTGLNTFDIESLRYYKWSEENRIACIHNDQLLLDVAPSSMQKIIVWDPSVAEKQRSSKNAMHVVAKGSHPFRFVLESRVGHYSPSDAIDILYELYYKWSPEFISIESRGFQGWVKYSLNDRAELTGQPYLPIVEWPPDGSSKAQWAKTEHIRGLQPVIRANLLWINEDNRELIDDIEFYPNIRWDDSLDALCQCLDYWPFSVDEVDIKRRRRRELDYLEMHVLGLAPDSKRETPAFNEMELLKRLDATGYTFLKA